MIACSLISIASEGGPSPNTLVATTNTLKLVVGEHIDEETSNIWLQTPSLHEEAGMISEPQLLLEAESE